MATRFKAIIPKTAELDAKPFIEAAKKTIDFADKQFAKTYKTWKHKPDFKTVIEEKRSAIIGSTTTTGEGSRDNPYPFITKGTKVRYATMTPDFIAKTKPRIIGSGRGRGGLAFVDTRRPKPGIKAREFEEEVFKKTEPVFIKATNKAMRIFVKKSGHQL